MTDGKDARAGAATAKRGIRGRRIGTATGVFPGRVQPLSEQQKRDRKAQQQRARRRRLRLRHYQHPQKIRAAYLAGQGYSSTQIVAAIGAAPGPSIRSILSKCGLKVVGRHDDVFRIVCLERKISTVRRVALSLDMDASAFILIAAEMVAVNEDLMARVAQWKNRPDQ